MTHGAVTDECIAALVFFHPSEFEVIELLSKVAILSDVCSFASLTQEGDCEFMIGIF